MLKAASLVILGLLLVLTSCRDTKGHDLSLQSAARKLLERDLEGAKAHFSGSGRMTVERSDIAGEYCHEWLLSLADTSLKIQHQGDTVLFETRSTRDYVIARNCHPPLPDGMSSSGGGDGVLHPEKSARIRMRTATSADSLALILEKIQATLSGKPR